MQHAVFGPYIAQELHELSISMERLKIAVVAPSGTFTDDNAELAYEKAQELNVRVIMKTAVRLGLPRFLNGSKAERLKELLAAESLDADAIWCARGGCGAITLWHDYLSEYYLTKHAPLIGYSDATILHFLRFYHAKRIGIHGPGFFEILKDYHASIEVLEILLRKQAGSITYPALKPLNNFLAIKLSGELVVMNLDCLEAIIGGFDTAFFRGKILALEDVNEPHYKVFEAVYHLKNVFALSGLRAILVGHFGKDRDMIIEETFKPLANEQAIPLFDWPIFGHELPDWPLLFGAQSTIRKIDENYFCPHL